MKAQEHISSNDNNSTWIYLSEISFSFVLENYIVSDACLPRLSLLVCYILDLIIPLPCRN